MLVREDRKRDYATKKFRDDFVVRKVRFAATAPAHAARATTRLVQCPKVDSVLMERVQALYEGTTLAAVNVKIVLHPSAAAARAASARGCAPKLS